MRTPQMKRSIWLLVFWLIGLQLIAPFVHAHLEADAIEHASVMHLHTASSSAHDHQHVTPAWENPHGPHQIVSIAEGLRKHLDLFDLADQLPSASFSLLPLLLCLSLLSLAAIPLRPARRHLCPQPQAPPSLH
jgi:hypothetical protein